MTENIVKYLSLISLILFIWSYAYLHGYYSSFHVEITSYISTTEVLYLALPVLILVFSTAMTNFTAVLSKYDDPVPDTREPQLRWFEYTGFRIAAGLLAGAGYFIHNNCITYRLAPLVQFLLGVLFFAAVLYVPVRKKISQNRLGFNVMMIIFIAAGFLLLNAGRNTAAITRRLGNTSRLHLRYGGAYIHTAEDTILLGETQSTLFFYLRKDSVTWIVSRSGVTDIWVKNR